jgi:hypothetical protein
MTLPDFMGVLTLRSVGFLTAMLGTLGAVVMLRSSCNKAWSESECNRPIGKSSRALIEERLAVRNRKPDSLPSPITRAPAGKVSLYEELVEYSEYLLVLSPEPLWQLWKKGAHDDEHNSPSSSEITQPIDFDADDKSE